MPVQRFLNGRPAAIDVDRGATGQEQFGDLNVVATSARDERAIEFSAGVDEDSRHVEFVRGILCGKHETLKQRGMAGERTCGRKRGIVTQQSSKTVAIVCMNGCDSG